MAAVNPLCVQNLQGSADSPESCRGRCRSQPFATKERYGCGSAACRYTSAHWAAADLSQIPIKTEAVFLVGSRGAGGNRNPPGLVFFSQSFLLEKQKKRLRGSRRFSRRIPTLICVPLTTKRHEFAFVFCLLPLPAAAVQVLRANDFVCKSGLDKGGILCYDALG